MERVVSATALLQMSKKHFHMGRFWHKSCTKCSPLLVHACPQSTVHLHRPDSGLADTFWHRAGMQPSLLSLPRLLFTYTCISRQPTRMHKLHPTLPTEEQLPFPSSTHAPKRLSETVTSLFYSTAHSSTRSIPRHKQPRTQKPNRTQTCSAIRLTTHLDLTFLKTSSTYSEGCNRGKTPALHIKKHSETNMCLTVHFTQLKKNAVTSCEMDKSL